MLFCTNCGNRLYEEAEFCPCCGQIVAGVFANQNTVIQGYAPYPQEFSISFGLGKRSIIKEKSLVHGNNEYPYAQLSPIRMLTAATRLTNGVAQVTANGKILTISYRPVDNERFAAAVTYANEQIDLAHGNSKKYKYILQSHTGTKLEIYEDYLILYYIETGAGSTICKERKDMGSRFLDGAVNVSRPFSNIMKGGSTGKVIMFEDLAVIQFNMDTLVIDEYSIPINPQNRELAEKIFAYIEEIRKSDKANTQAQPEEHELWEPIKSVAREFPISDMVLEVPENIDAFNTYRLKFRELASKCADNFEKEYYAKVHGFETYMVFFPKIYKKNLATLIKRAIDILVAEEVYTVAYDLFMEQHITDFHLAYDTYEATWESVTLTMKANQQRKAIMSVVPNLIGGGFGLEGAFKGIAGATAFNVVRDGIESSVMKNALNINALQQLELYNRLNPTIIIEHVFLDYWRVFLSLVNVLKQNGCDIWWPISETDQEAANIFQNLSNPNFPKEKILDAMLSVIKMNPYNAEYYKFIISKFGESKEVTVIKDYFGYTDFDNPRIV